MKHRTIRKVPFRRRQEGKTNYRARLRLLKSGISRAVVRHTLRNVTVQFIEYEAKSDVVLTSAHSRELKDLGWDASRNNTPAAYLTGLLAGKRAVKHDITNAVLDIGLRVPVKGSKIFASLKGMLDAGVAIPHGDDIFPSPERIEGTYLNEKVNKQFEEVKDKIIEMYG